MDLLFGIDGVASLVVLVLLGLRVREMWVGGWWLEESWVRPMLHCTLGVLLGVLMVTVLFVQGWV